MRLSKNYLRDLCGRICERSLDLQGATDIWKITGRDNYNTEIFLRIQRPLPPLCMINRSSHDADSEGSALCATDKDFAVRGVLLASCCRTLVPHTRGCMHEDTRGLGSSVRFSWRIIHVEHHPCMSSSPCGKLYGQQAP